MARALVAALVGLVAHGCNTLCEGPACEAELDPCMRDGMPRLRLQTVRSLATSEFANPEIVSFIPGVGELRALVTSTRASRVSELVFDDGRIAFGKRAKIETGETTTLTSVAVAPSGKMAAITLFDDAEECDDDDQCIGGECVDGGCRCYPGALPGCRCGAVQLVDIRPKCFGDELGSPIGVGYAPDSGAFSAKGDYFITADEDEQDCKGERWGGSVSIIEIDPFEEADCVSQPDSTERGRLVGQIVADHEIKAQPEGVVVTDDGHVVVAIQESSDIGFFTLGPTPTGWRTMRGNTDWGHVPILAKEPAEDGSEDMELDAQPDGLALTPDGKWVAVGLEKADAIAVFDVVERRQVGDPHYIADDVPSRFNRDWRKDTKQHEPEQMAFVESESGALFLVVALQESHALIAYRFDRDDGSLEFDSIAAVGLAPEEEAFGRVESGIGPEGVAVATEPGTGRSLFLTANERDGSVTFLRSICPAR